MRLLQGGGIIHIWCVTGIMLSEKEYSKLIDDSIKGIRSPQPHSIGTAATVQGKTKAWGQVARWIKGKARSVSSSKGMLSDHREGSLQLRNVFRRKELWNNSKVFIQAAPGPG